MKTTSRNPDSVSSVKMTPLEARSARTIFMTADRQCDFEMVEAVVDAIDDGPVSEDRGKTAPARLDHLGLAAHVKETFVLPGEARGRQVLGGRRAAHRNCDPGAAFRLERAIRRRDLAAQFRIAGGFVDQMAGSLGALGQKLYIVMVKIGKEAAQPVPGTSESERLAISTGSERKAVGDPTAIRREQGRELAQ